MFALWRESLVLKQLGYGINFENPMNTNIRIITGRALRTPGLGILTKTEGKP
jgi:hypothetical protein